MRLGRGTLAGFGRRVVAGVLVGALLAPSTAFAGPRGPKLVKPGPESAATLAQWSRVQKVPLPSAVDIATDDESGHWLLFSVSDDSVALLDIDRNALGWRAARDLRGLAKNQRELLANPDNGAMLKNGRVSIGPNGLFVNGNWVAERDAVVKLVPREHVRNISGTVVARGSAQGALAGAAAGFVAGFFLWVGKAIESDKPESLFVNAGLLAVGSGLLAGNVSTRATRGVIYQRAD